MPFILTISHVDPFPTQLQQQRTRSILRNGFVVETISKRKTLVLLVNQPLNIVSCKAYFTLILLYVRLYAKVVVVTILRPNCEDTIYLP